MKTYTQTFAGAQTWELNVPGNYFTILACTNALNIRLYKGGKKLDLGDMTGLLAGLEVAPKVIGPDGMAFDRVQVDVGGADTVQVGIGNGDARYNRSQGNVAITNSTLPVENKAGTALQVEMRGTSYTNSWSSTNALVANTAEQIIAPAANVNGIDVYSAQMALFQSSTFFPAAFVAKASAPAAVTDGDVIAVCSTSSLGVMGGTTTLPLRIPAGKGLYLIASNAVAAGGALASCLYEVL